LADREGEKGRPSSRDLTWWCHEDPRFISDKEEKEEKEKEKELS